MKVKRILFLVVLVALLGNSLFAQDLPGFNYQAVARDTEGNVIGDTKIDVLLQIIHQEKEAIVWEETHSLTTNTLGMFSIAIGTDSKSVTQSEVENLSEIRWNDGSYTLKVSVNDKEIGSSKILSVPMAMYGADEDADPRNELQELSLNGGVLEISQKSTSIDLSNFLASELAAGSVGVGASSAESVLDVVGSATGNDPIFQVKNNDGIPVFAVYNEGVRIYIPENLTPTKGIKGGFAVGGYNTSKALDTEDYFLKVMPHGSDISFFAEDNDKGNSYSKGIKGGFAVGGYNNSKASKSPFIYMDPYAAPLTLDNGLIVIPSLFDNLYPKGNCYVGTMAGNNQVGHFNTSIGYQSGYNITARMVEFPFSTNARCNTYIGGFSGYENSLGDENVYIGYQAGLKNQGSGNVFIGNQSGADYTNVSNKLIFDNDAEDTSPLIFGDFYSDYLHFNANIGVNRASSTSYGMWVDGGTGSYSMRIENGLIVYGPIYASGTVTQNSDIRLKTNIQSIPNPLNIIKSLRGVRYNWNKEFRPTNSTRDQIGVIAQEVEKVLPELVITGEDGYKSVAYSNLSALLIEAVKEQQEQIEEQQRLIKELLKRVEDLEKE